MSLIECVPNVSEGRRPRVIADLGAAVTSAGAALLDVHSDAAHHRSVFTFVGTAGEVAAAVHALFDTAVPAIDLRAHQGVHPRLGAVDVVPFVPISLAIRRSNGPASTRPRVRSAFRA
jgi:glutamate formiminotransferase